MSTTSGLALQINFRELDAPFLSTDIGRQEVSPELPAPGTGPALAPRIAHMRNVFPTQDGYSSLERMRYAPPDLQSVRHAFSFTASNGLDYLCAVRSDRLAFCQVGTSIWTEQEFPQFFPPWEVTSVQLDGQHYFLLSNSGAFRFVPDAQQLEPVTLTALNIAAIRGITAASGYLIAFDENTIYWDSPQARLNFTPAIGGAGSSRAAQLQGSIVAVHPLANGYIIYSTKNAVAAQFSGNPNAPWVFREVPRSSGITNQYNVAFQNNFPGHFVWTNSGLQEIGFSEASSAFPQVTDFLNKQTIEEFFSPVGFIRTQAGNAFEVKLQLIAHRYLTLSFGNEDQEFPQALVYDLQLQRWGRLNTPHRALFALATDQRQFFISYQYEFLNENRTYAEAQAITYANFKAETAPNPHLSTRIASATSFGEVFAYSLTVMPNVDVSGEVLDFFEDFFSIVVVSPISFRAMRPALMHEFEIQNYVPRITYLLTYDGEALYDGQYLHNGGWVYTLFHDAEIVADGSEDADGRPSNDPRIPDVWVFSSLTFDTFETPEYVRPFSRPRSSYVQRFTRRKTARHFGIAFAGKFNLTNMYFRYEPISGR